MGCCRQCSIIGTIGPKTKSVEMLTKLREALATLKEEMEVVAAEHSERMTRVSERAARAEAEEATTAGYRHVRIMFELVPPPASGTMMTKAQLWLNIGRAQNREEIIENH